MLPTATGLHEGVTLLIPILIQSEKLLVICTQTLWKSVLLGVCTRIDCIHQ